MKFFKFIDTCVEKFSLWTLIISIIAMAGFALTTIVLRWFNITYLWMDPLVRHLVFMSAFLGGVLATGARNHIGIDVISKVLESKHMHTLNNNLRRLVDLSAVCVLLWLTKAAIDFVKMEQEFGGEVFLGLHSGYLVLMIPIGFGLITYRFFYNFISSFNNKVVL